ncbi:MAG: helicase-related protein [Isosphaerales bacterium]
MKYAVGTLVKARNRERVVLPESQEDFLVVRPLGGTDVEVAGIDPEIEEIRSADFPPPDPNFLGDHQSCRLLRDAIRLGFRSSAGPFRSFGKIAVEPRSYQLVPLLMALKMDPIRLLVADDVGIGKTVESLLVARELLDRGEIRRFAVLCPPHLAEQWQAELKDKFHIDAELVLSSTARRLDRVCGNRSVFDVFDFTVVSLDYIKTDNRRDDFIRACPELIIVDEAHTCTNPAQPGRGTTARQQRNQLIQSLSRKGLQHLVLVTATPHSGNPEGFRSLLTLLRPDFAGLPANLSGDENRKHREELAKHFVQRRRGDILHYVGDDTAFPVRKEKEETYQLGTSSDYRKLFDRLLKYAREVVQDSRDLTKVRQRMRWWAALALLRAAASSPAAAAATLRSKLRAIGAETIDDVDAVSRPLVLDEDIDELIETPDGVAGSDTNEGDEETTVASPDRERLLELARAADRLKGKGDPKLLKAVPILKDLIQTGNRPIVFCRFIATAEYLADELRSRLPKDVTVIPITGNLPPEDRADRIRGLDGLEKYVLVCTDCLSEGVNLQQYFDTVVHYDLAWNPTRHEQREGRVDRFGQVKPEVRVVTYYGVDNQIDGLVLKVLIDKHEKIRKDLGISIPVPSSSNAVLEALYEGLLLKNRDAQQLLLFEEDDDLKSKVDELDSEWKSAADREKKSRALFAQHKFDDRSVAREVEAIRTAIGSATDVEQFVTTAVRGYGGTATKRRNFILLDVKETPAAIRETAAGRDEVRARFELPVGENELYLSRTHPLVEGLASFAMESALDPVLAGGRRVLAARCGAIRTKSVETRTTLLLVWFRYHILTTIDDVTRPLLAEDCQVVAFSGAPTEPTWLSREVADGLLGAEPDENVADDVARSFVRKVLENLEPIRKKLDAIAKERGQELLAAHKRVRQASHRRGVKETIEPQLPADILGLYVYLPTS